MSQALRAKRSTGERKLDFRKGFVLRAPQGGVKTSRAVKGEASHSNSARISRAARRGAAHLREIRVLTDATWKTAPAIRPRWSPTSQRRYLAALIPRNRRRRLPIRGGRDPEISLAGGTATQCHAQMYTWARAAARQRGQAGYLPASRAANWAAGVRRDRATPAPTPLAEDARGKKGERSLCVMSIKVDSARCTPPDSAARAHHAGEEVKNAPKACRFLVESRSPAGH